MECRALSIEHRALLTEYRALLTEYKALLRADRTTLSMEHLMKYWALSITCILVQRSRRNQKRRSQGVISLFP